jgi:hypothetical protein
MSLLFEELKQLRTEPRDLRKFGLMVGGVFVAVGLWFAFRHNPWHAWFWVPGALLIVAGLTAPLALRRIYVIWMGVAFFLGFIVSSVLLAIIFYGMVTPIGLVARLAGKDFLDRGRSTGGSYWIIRSRDSSRPPSAYEQQF